MNIAIPSCLSLILFSSSLGQGPPNDLKQFIRVDSNVVALTHVRIVDGTGAAPMEDQTILIVDGKITEIHPSAAVFAKEGIKTIDLNGYQVLPGSVGMHDHTLLPVGGS